jgi:Domain of unknown function (DUF4262)
LTLSTDGLDDQERRVVTNVEQFGTHVVQVYARPGVDDGFSFTIGMQYTFGHPELIVFGQKPDWQGALLNALREEVRAGIRFQPGSTCTEVLPGYTLVFRDVPVEQHAEYFGWALWFYDRVAPASGPLRALQVVWPDLKDRLPWEPGYDNPYSQPLLDGTPLVAQRNPFPFGLDDLVLVCSRVAADDAVLYVHGGETSEDWQFLCGASHEPEALAASGEKAGLLHLRHILEADPNIDVVADLGPADYAMREHPGAAWTRWSD